MENKHLLDSWVASDQVRALSSGEAELHGIVDGSARGIFTKHMHEEMGRTINIDVETDSTAANGMCSRTGVGKTRHIQVRWLWIQDAIRDKVVRLSKVKSSDNKADMGTKDLDGPTHQRLLKKLPLKPTQCRRLLGLIATANGASFVEAQMTGTIRAIIITFLIPGKAPTVTVICFFSFFFLSLSISFPFSSFSLHTQRRDQPQTCYCLKLPYVRHTKSIQEVIK